MVLDCFNMTATVDGVDLTAQVAGSWITAAPGTNSIRLLGGSTNAVAHMNVAALAAWR
jgi:hypothetical protein